MLNRRKFLFASAAAAAGSTMLSAPFVRAQSPPVDIKMNAQKINHTIAPH